MERWRGSRKEEKKEKRGVARRERENSQLCQNITYAQSIINFKQGF